MRVPTELGEIYVEDLPAETGSVGGAPTVVFFHSYLQHGGMWKGQIERLRARYRTINIDAPGHGRSSPLRGPIDMDGCVRAVVDVLDARAVDRCAFVGLSWGGMVGMHLALRAPRRLEGLALLDTSCRAEPLHNRVKYLAMGTVTRKLGMVPMLLDQVEKLFFSDRSLRDRRDLVDAWRGYVERMDRESIWHALRCIIDRADITEDLLRCSQREKIPTLVVVGGEDRAQPPRESAHIASAVEGSRMMLVRGAGHLSALEAPEETNAILEPFLERVFRSFRPQATA